MPGKVAKLQVVARQGQIRGRDGRPIETSRLVEPFNSSDRTEARFLPGTVVPFLGPAWRAESSVGVSVGGLLQLRLCL